MGFNLPSDIASGRIAEMHRRICHALHDVHLAARMPRAFLNEHQAAQNGTSYKAKLKAAIDRLLPACSNLEELLRRLQREGYEIKRGKYISARAPDQERFTRLKTLGVDYTEEALAARIAGRSRPSRQPKQQDGKISLLIDTQNNIKAQQSAGFTHWAKLNNLKQAAKTMNFLTEQGISNYGELESKLTALSARRDTSHAEIKRIESRSAELTLVMKHAGTYRQLKPIYDRYRKSNNKEKFLRGHESEIILFEAAARELKRLGAVPADRWMIFCVMEIWKTAASADGKAIHSLMEKGKPFPTCLQTAFPQPHNPSSLRTFPQRLLRRNLLLL